MAQLESENQRSDDTADEERERYRELLEELRTVIPGAQVLFAFLLTAPFSSRFSEIDSLGKIIFGISLAAIAIATILFFRRRRTTAWPIATTAGRG